MLKAMELKRLYVPLSPAQQQLYDSQNGGRNAVEEEPQEAPAQEQTQAVRSAESKEKADLDIFERRNVMSASESTCLHD